MRRAEAGIQVDKFYPPTDWQDSNNEQIDIRKNAENNTIVLLVGHSADFTKYSLLGLLVDTSSGTYDIYIDDVLVGSGITKNTQYDIDFSTINTSYGSATTPEALVLHKVVVKPNTSGKTITTFRCARTVGVSTNQEQGVLWCHFELSNRINIQSLFMDNYNNVNLLAITSKNHIFKVTNISSSFRPLNKLKYISILDITGNSIGGSFNGNKNIKRIILLNETNLITQTAYAFSNCEKLEQINIKKIIYSSTSSEAAMNNNYKLKQKPNIDETNCNNLNNYLNNDTELYPTKLDVSSATTLTKIGTYGNSTYQMRGLKGLKVSNEAPFSGSSPQIDVSYTGLDRDALVELFQSLPTVTGGQTLNCVACSGNNLSKVGSPTIDENGVASGFSMSNYFQLRSQTIGDYFEFEFNIVFVVNSYSTINTNLIVRLSGPYGGLRITSDGYISFTLLSGSYKGLKSDVVVENGEKYIANIKLKNGVLVFKAKKYSDIVWSSKDLQLEKINLTTGIMFGRGASDYTYFDGSIDFEQTFIKSGQNYQIKGYLTDTDKAIATDKGWGLVLS